MHVMWATHLLKFGLSAQRGTLAQVQTVCSVRDWFEEEERKKMDMDETNRIATILVYLTGAALPHHPTPAQFEHTLQLIAYPR